VEDSRRRLLPSQTSRMARQRGFTRGPSGPKRQTTWIGPADQAFIGVAAGSAVIISSFTPATAVPSMIKPTIIRTRGEVAIAPTLGALSADVTIVGAYGLAVVSTAALTAGVASIPTPWEEPGWDGWFVWRSFGLSFDNIDSTGVIVTAHQQEVDSKAMRKVTAAESVVLVAESQATGFVISMALRMLLKLS